MFRNLSPRALTIYIAVFVSLFNVAIQVVFTLINGLELNVLLLVVSGLGSLIICYLIVRFFIVTYLIKKIRLIYNIIQQSKFGKSSDIKNESSLISGNVWKSVESDVKKWANLTEEEIKNLKELEKYRKEFVGNISHELKTPIFTIQGYIHTLLEGGLEDKNVNVRFLNRAAINVDRLITIVEDLEVISKLESGSDTLEVEVFDLKKLTYEVIMDLEVQAKQKGIKLKYDTKAPNFQVKGDREKFRQVYNNLIFNSIKYGREKGTTNIEFFDLEEYILVEVSDNGIGIQQKHLNHLFDRFYRVDKSRSRDVGGSGLGLAIVKHIVEAHNQTINVRSKQGEGSTFGFTIAKA
ncbi:sensor histidine kinase [Portibacter marinus]|uniref:sensor histidine kinase n=1 Tax=Portibacter marinus TaxID=2898660 RepID=UPI001F2F04B5|nr:ATP-binding protein [Portibacter marinus]